MTESPGAHEAGFVISTNKIFDDKPIFTNFCADKATMYSTTVANGTRAGRLDAHFSRTSARTRRR
jgi:hypothetical protein